MRSGTIVLRACGEAPRRGAPGKFRIGGKKPVKTEGKLKFVAENLEKPRENSTFEGKHIEKHVFFNKNTLKPWKTLGKLQFLKKKIAFFLCFSTKIYEVAVRLQ